MTALIVTILVAVLGQDIRSIAPHLRHQGAGRINAAPFSPDGKWLTASIAVGKEPKFVIADIAAGTWKIRDHTPSEGPLNFLGSG